ncbi:1-pyrroline-5-carboxylate dehydrogenase [Eoetvoesiella caeni]
MGEPLYRQVVGPAPEGGLDRPCRVYAPVGTHDSLLAYLARRLLENGANTSFVNRIADEACSIESLVEDPVRDIEQAGKADGRMGLPHPKIPLPASLFGQSRINSAGLARTVLPAARATPLETAANALERETYPFVEILIREAAKTYADAIAEVREAVDFLRFYARQAKTCFANDTHESWGPVACISPWNFPLSIFTGQVCAALAAGNTVLAKPAEQTPLVAYAMVRLLLNAGIPAQALQLLPGPGSATGAALVADERVKGVLFTGSTEVARTLAAQTAGRVGPHGRQVPLIAETGGQNAMMVDSSALPEQVVSDVLASAFGSAGQRCSALRILCLQEDIAEPMIRMLKGAMAEQAVGDPALLATDIGPVIDDEAKTRLLRHVERLRTQGCAVFQAHDQSELDQLDGAFVAPTLVEIPSVSLLEREVFGPVLHLIRYRRQDFDPLIGQINKLGYGLTFGLHSRIDATIAKGIDLAKAGNVYVNRGIVGAVVGVQPFGGEGLSGTGPKAGGPLYALRLLSRKPAEAAASALEAPGLATRPSWRGMPGGRWPENCETGRPAKAIRPADRRRATLSPAPPLRWLLRTFRWPARNRCGWASTARAEFSYPQNSLRFPHRYRPCKTGPLPSGLPAYSNSCNSCHAAWRAA